MTREENEVLVCDAFFEVWPLDNDDICMVY